MTPTARKGKKTETCDELSTTSNHVQLDQAPIYRRGAGRPALHSLSVIVTSRKDSRNLLRRLLRGEPAWCARSRTSQPRNFLVFANRQELEDLVDFTLKEQLTVLPCVLARGGVSATSPRLWPAAPLTVAVQGRDTGQHLIYCLQQAAVPAIGPSGRIPSIPEGTRGACKLQEEPVSERKQGEYPYPLIQEKRTRPRHETRTHGCVPVLAWSPGRRQSQD